MVHETASGLESIVLKSTDTNTQNSSSPSPSGNYSPKADALLSTLDSPPKEHTTHEQQSSNLLGTSVTDATSGGRGERRSGQFARMQLPYDGPPVPSNESERMATIDALCDLSQPADPRCEALALLLCGIFKVELGFIAMSTSHAFGILGSHGDGAPVGVGKMKGICHWTLTSNEPEVLVIEDLKEDARSRDHPIVTGEPFARFFVAAPMVASNHHRIGSVCLVEKAPQRAGIPMLQMLANLAELTVRLLEESLPRPLPTVYQQTPLLRPLGAALGGAGSQEGVMLIDVSKEGWEVLILDGPASEQIGLPFKEAVGKLVYDLLELPGQSTLASWVPSKYAAAAGAEFQLMLRRKGAPAGGQQLIASFCPAVQEVFRPAKPLLAIPVPLGDTPDGPDLSKYYFVCLSPDADVAAGPTDSGEAVQKLATLAVGGKRTSFDSQSAETTPSAKAPRRSYDGSSRKMVLNRTPFQDLSLGPLIGSGSAGRVFFGLWDNRRVAVKILDVLAPHTEAELGMRISHPNVVRTYRCSCTEIEDMEWEGNSSSVAGGSGESSCWGSYHDVPTPATQRGQTFMIMELCDRGSLARAVDRGWFRKVRSVTNGSPNMATVLSTAAEIASAMAHLHEHNILHGDLSNGNVLLCSSKDDNRGFIAKVADFGMSRVTSVTIKTSGRGTVTHCAPEMLGSGILTKAADVYSFGVLCYEMYMGQCAHAGLIPAHIIYMITMVRTGLELPEDAPPAFKALVESCLAFDSRARPTFKVIHEQLVAWLQGGLPEAFGVEDLRPPAFLYPSEKFKEACLVAK